MQVQTALDSDVVMVFDECPPYPSSEAQARQSMELSMRWARRSRDAFRDLGGPAGLGHRHISKICDGRRDRQWSAAFQSRPTPTDTSSGTSSA